MCYHQFMNDLKKAKNLLKDDITCVILKDNQIYLSKDNSIRPLLNLLNENIDLKGYVLADKVIGKAQAFLCVKANISKVYTYCLSKEGKMLLDKYNIEYEYTNLVENILNNKGNDICPMEKTVKDIDNPEIAFKELNKKIKELDS